MKPHRIERLYAWIVKDATGEDGVPAFRGADGAAMPMIGSDKERIESLRPLVERLNREEGYPVRLVEFTAMVVLETIPGRDDLPRHS